MHHPFALNPGLLQRAAIEMTQLLVAVSNHFIKESMRLHARHMCQMEIRKRTHRPGNRAVPAQTHRLGTHSLSVPLMNTNMEIITSVPDSPAASIQYDER